MSEKSKNMILRKDFFAWLREGTEPLQFVGNTKSCTTFVKLPHGENAFYLFSATHYTGTGIRWNTPFEFCGMYFPETQTLRLAEFDLARAVDQLEADEMQSIEHWRGHISQTVNERVKQKIANDWNNLSIQKLSDPKNIQWLQEFREYGAKRQAASIFLRGDAPDLELHSFYNLQAFPDAYQEDSMNLYFLDTEKFLEDEAQKYIDAHEEDILLTFLQKDLLRKEYEALEQDTGGDFSRQRQITVAIRNAAAKTVVVTVEKDGEELTFRVEAREIACGRYSRYGIVSTEDRQKFQALFGRYADYSVQDITRITYGRNVLYEAPQEQAEEMDAGMTMA